MNARKLLRHLTTACFLPAFLVALGGGAAAPDAALVGHWNFDEGRGDRVKDVSGHGLDGAVRGAKWAEGKAGGGVECDQDALVEVPYALDLDAFADGLTVTAWVHRNPDATWNTVASREVKAGPSEYFGLAVVKNKALFSVDPDGAHYKNIKGDDDVPAGRWVHLAGTYDNATMKLYVDGRLVKSGPAAGRFKFADQNPLIIGGNTNTQGKKWVDCFHGRIDDVRLYRRALDEKDVQAVFAAAADKP